MRSQQLVGVHARRRWRRGRPDTAPAPDLGHPNFNPPGPDRLWAADVTQFRTAESWLHLAAVIDLWSRRVVGWAMGPTVNAELVTDALVMAFHRRRPDRRVVHHSDRGAASTSLAFPAGRRARGRPVLRIHRRLLRQRRRRVVLRHPQTRARLDPRHQDLGHPSRPPLSAVRLHRRLLQPRTHPTPTRPTKPRHRRARLGRITTRVHASGSTPTPWLAHRSGASVGRPAV
jgi:Integrase core domain